MEDVVEDVSISCDGSAFDSTQFAPMMQCADNRFFDVIREDLENFATNNPFMARFLQDSPEHFADRFIYSC